MVAPFMKRQKEEVKPKIQSLLFEALEADGINYLEWSNDANAHLAVEELDGTLKEEMSWPPPQPQSGKPW